MAERGIWQARIGRFGILKKSTVRVADWTKNSGGVEWWALWKMCRGERCINAIDN